MISPDFMISVITDIARAVTYIQMPTRKLLWDAPRPFKLIMFPVPQYVILTILVIYMTINPVV